MTCQASYISLRFSAACAVALAHRYHVFLVRTKRTNFPSKVKSRQASNRCKGVLEAANLAYANITKESITF